MATTIYINTKDHRAEVDTWEEAGRIARDLLKKSVVVYAYYVHDNKHGYREMTQKKPYWHENYGGM